MPNETISKLASKIKKETYWSFAATVIFGLLIHGYKFLNHLPNWDSLMYYYYPTNNMIRQGRHLQIVATILSGFGDLPWVIGLVCLGMMGITVALLVDLFGIHEKGNIILFAGIMVSFPTFTSCFAYMYMADAFYCSLMVSVLAVWLTIKYKKGLFFGACLLALGMGAYQAYLPYAITLILVWVIYLLVFEKKSVVDLVAPLIRLFFMGVMGAIVYAVSLKAFLFFQQTTMYGHQGMGSMGVPDLQRIIDAFVQSYIDSIYFFVGSLSELSLNHVANWIALIVLFIAIVLHLMASQKGVGFTAYIIVCGCVLLFPLTNHIFYLLTPDVSYHVLMQGGLSLVYLIVILTMEKSEKRVKSINWILFVSLCIIIYTSGLAANKGYAAMEKSQAKTYSMVGRIVDRMEQMPEYNSATKIAVIGKPEHADKVMLEYNPTIAGFTDEYFISSQPHLVAMLAEYFQVELTGVSEEELEELEKTDIYSSMDVWPGKNSVVQQGDTIIIKWGNE